MSDQLKPLDFTGKQLNYYEAIAINSQFANTVTMFMEYRGITDEDIARALDISIEHWNMILAGETFLKMEHLGVLSQTYNVRFTLSIENVIADNENVHPLFRDVLDDINPS